MRLIKIIAGIATVFLALALPLALLLPGERSLWEAYVYWALAIPGVLAAWFALESFGTWFFDRPWFNRLSSPLRIVIAALALIAMFGVIAGMFQIFDTHSR